MDAAERYQKRLGHFAQTECVRLKDATPAQEARGMAAAIPAGAHIIALDEKGKLQSTSQLVQFYAERHRLGQSRYVYLIGGADGFSPQARTLAHATWSLSPMTMPHRAVLALWMEQLYRVHATLAGQAYHRE